MLAKDFLLKIRNKIGINAPLSRGDAYPEFDESRINESEFLDDLRGKSIDFDTRDNTLYINWVAMHYPEVYNQDECDEINEPFYDEIKRCVSYLASKAEVEDSFNLKIRLSDRNKTYSTSKTFTIEPNY